MLAITLVAGLFLYWRFFEFRVGASEIRIDSGILQRTHRSIPFDRIQDVDITQPLLARAFGLARVKFETGASAGAKEDEGVLQAIALTRAQDLRALVRARRGAAAEAPALDSCGTRANLRHGPPPRAPRRRVQFLARGFRGPVRG